MNKELVHQLGQQLIRRRAGFGPNLAEVDRPLRHAFVDDGNIEITLFTKLLDGGVDNRHFLIGQRFVDAQLDFRTILCEALPNLRQVVAQHRDTPLDFTFVVAVVEPLTLTVVANLKVTQVFQLRIQKRLKQGVFAAQLLEGILSYVDGSFLVGLALFKLFGFI